MTVGMLCGVRADLHDADHRRLGIRALLPGYMLFGIALGLVYAPMSSAAMAAMPPEKAGIASGVLAMNRVLAGAVGLAATGAVFQSLVGDQGFPTRPARSIWVLVGLVAVGTVLTWRFVRSAAPPTPDPAVAGSTASGGAAPSPPSPALSPLRTVGQRGPETEAYPGRMAAVEPHLGTADGPVTAADVERAAELIAGDVRRRRCSPRASSLAGWARL